MASDRFRKYLCTFWRDLKKDSHLNTFLENLRQTITSIVRINLNCDFRWISEETCQIKTKTTD